MQIFGLIAVAPDYLPELNGATLKRPAADHPLVLYNMVRSVRFIPEE